MKKTITILLLIFIWVNVPLLFTAQSMAEQMASIVKENRALTQENVELANKNLAYKKKIHDQAIANYKAGMNPFFINTKDATLGEVEKVFKDKLSAVENKNSKLVKQKKYWQNEAKKFQKMYNDLLVEHQELILAYEEEKVQVEELKEKNKDVYERLLSAKDTISIYKQKYWEEKRKFDIYRTQTEIKLQAAELKIDEQQKEIEELRIKENDLNQKLAMISSIFQIRGIRECNIEFSNKSEGYLMIEHDFTQIQHLLKIFNEQGKKARLKIELTNIYKWKKPEKAYREHIPLSNGSSSNKIKRSVYINADGNFYEAYVALFFRHSDGKNIFKDGEHYEFNVNFYLEIEGEPEIHLEMLETIVKKNRHDTSRSEESFFSAFLKSVIKIDNTQNLN